jgi:hypothetical protein
MIVKMLEKRLKTTKCWHYFAMPPAFSPAHFHFTQYKN